MESSSAAYERLVQRLRGEIAKARSLHAKYGGDISRSENIAGLLACYRRAMEDTAMLNREMEVPATCSRCATGVAGGCCFQGIEEGYDHVLLLTNLLMGCSIPDSPEMPGSCFFVGKLGCKLVARFYFCLHYFCPDLKYSLGPSGISRLLGKLGAELQAGWELEQAIRGWLKSVGNNPCLT